MDTSLPSISRTTKPSGRHRHFAKNSVAAPAPRTIVIVGAGFSGAMVATNLLRLPQEEPLHVVLVDRAPSSRGVAYAQRRYPYLLNVPAGRMSASSTDPGEFLTFAQQRLPASTADDFLPRELYGQYLESLLANAALAAPPHVHLVPVRGSVIAIERGHRTRLLHVHLDDGRKIAADTLVLALGNLPPAPLAGDDALQGSSRYVKDPWRAPPAFHSGETVLIVGTGLTMADVALAGSATAKGKAVIHALSRHGLVPPPQTAFRHLYGELDGTPLKQAASISLRQLCRAIRRLSNDIELHGGDWREMITSVRALAPALWQLLPLRERRRFLRHVRCYWDVHRHRLPLATWSALNELRRRGNLHVHAGRLLGLERVGKQIRATWRARGASGQTTMLVDRVVNCTGPQYDARRSADSLLRSMIAHGIAVPDPLGLGLVTHEFGALEDASGRVADNIYYIGPMLRPRHWETTAVQELRAHAERLACHLAALSGPQWMPPRVHKSDDVVALARAGI
jgi:uncharacterized NAD(P)/FAD-binding protein YdhS